MQINLISIISYSTARICRSLAACQRHTPSSPAAVIGLSDNDVISLRFLRSLRCVRCVGWKPRFKLKPTSADRWSWPTFWAWFSFRRQSADEIVEPWHVSLVTSRQWRQKMADDKDADAFMLLYFLTAKQHKKRTDFTYTRTALRLFFCFSFFSSFQLALFPSV